MKLTKVKKEKAILSRRKLKDVSEEKETSYEFPACREASEMKHRPVVVGSGPAGLFCAYLLAKHEYRPILIERGAPVEERKKAVEAFWETGVLDTRTNVQFGEGGAGTFSDGKLNTLVKDPAGRNREVLKIFVAHGAPEEILYENKPHIGTDILIDVVRRMRESIEDSGGECRFYTKLTGTSTGDGRVKEIRIEEQGKESLIPAEVVVLALGHSARDTFAMLKETGELLEAKLWWASVSNTFRNGLTCPSMARNNIRIFRRLHISDGAENGRGVYTFCMCPGGYVVTASSEEGRLCVNGMSYHGRAGENANSAVIVTVTPEDYAADGNQIRLAGGD